jgi:hypothetical protein
MPVSAYIPHVIYSTALTSLSFHLLFHKKQAEMDRSHLSAQISILESLAHRLRSGQDVSDEEVERLFRLAQTHEETHAKGVMPMKEKVRWKDVFWGKKVDGGVERDGKDLEDGESPDPHIRLISFQFLFPVRRELERL